MVASRSRVLYVGVTNDLRRRVQEHKDGATEGFTKRYRVNRLVWAEEAATMDAAIAREKQLKRWRREKKIALIEAMNPEWDDLATTL